MTDIARFVGVPFADHGRDGGFDCWGLVRAALAACRGLTLPDYGGGYADCGDHEGIAVSIRQGLAADFVRVDRPQPFDLVIFNIAGQPRHVGLMLDDVRFLHAPEGQTSRIERIDDRLWHKRIEGFYRYAR